jgi:hypothetical protein
MAERNVGSFIHTRGSDRKGGKKVFGFLSWLTNSAVWVASSFGTTGILKDALGYEVHKNILNLKDNGYYCFWKEGQQRSELLWKYGGLERIG